MEPRKLEGYGRSRVECGQLELLLVLSRSGTHLDLAAECVSEGGYGFPGRAEQYLRDLGVDGHGDSPAAEAAEILAHLAQHLVRHALRGEHVATALAVAARLAQLLHQVFACALARHLDEPEFRDLQDVRLRLVGAQGFSERAVDLVPIVRGLHVDQVDDDQPADVPEAELVNDLRHGFEVGFEDCFLEIGSADVAARVHVDRGEGFALVDDQVAPGLEPDLAPQVGVDLQLDAEVVEDRRVAVVAFEYGLRVGDETREEVLHRLEALRVIHDDPLRLRVGEVADHAQGQGKLGVEWSRCPHLALADLHVIPYLREIADVRLEVGIAGALAGGADDEAQVLGPAAAHRVAQAPSLAVGIDPARDAYAL